MAKAILQSLSVLLACLILQPTHCFARQSLSATRRDTVESFLQTWLVRKDLPSSLRFFHRNAFSNERVFDCGCCLNDFASKAERRNPKAAERVIKDFLKDYSDPIKGDSLNEILFLKGGEHPEESKELDAKLRKWVLNPPERDKFYLVNYRMLKSEVERYFEKQYSLKGAFFSVIQYRVLNTDERYGDDMVVALLWVRDKGTWKIAHVKVACN
jgi:hypothetical protein